MVAEIPEEWSEDSQGLKAWLDRLPLADKVPFARILRHRAAMRVLPCVARAFSIEPASSEAPCNLMLAVFRANAISQVSLKHQTSEIEFAASAASVCVSSAAAFAGSAASAADAARNSTLAASITSATYAAYASAQASTVTTDTIYYATVASPDIVWETIGADVQALMAGGMGALIHAPLWLGTQPSWWLSELEKLYAQLQNSSVVEHRETVPVCSQVWLDWYAARAEGKSPWGLPEATIEQLEMRIALGDSRDDFWGSKKKPRRPEAINAEISGWVNAALAAQRLAVAQQDNIGNHWRESEKFLEIGNEVAAGDLEVARNPATQKAQRSLLRKALKFGGAAREFDELYGWAGFGDDYNRLTTALECKGDGLADHIWDIYDATLTVASYLQQDNDIRGSSPAFSNAALSAAHRREFIDLVRSLAPWVRRFPTAQQEDENAANFLQRVSEQLTSSLLESAHQRGVITDKDRELIKALLAAMERNGLPAEKAGIRAHFSVRNLTFAGAMFLAGSVASGTVEKTELHGKITDWMAERVDDITEIVADAPDDIQVIIKDILADIAGREQGGDDGPDVPTLPDGGVSRRRRRG